MTNSEYNLTELYGNDYDKRSIKERLELKGVVVTDTKHRKDKSKRLLTDEFGVELGYFKPLESIKHFKA
tara:strand:+ start:388 stop:594 length:207 start_codon:yes stop_codon:yes gene_type:complete